MSRGNSRVACLVALHFSVLCLMPSKAPSTPMDVEPGVVLGRQCLVAANSVILSGTQVPDRSFFTGVPGSVKRQVTPQQISAMSHTATELVQRAKRFKDSGL